MRRPGGRHTAPRARSAWAGTLALVAIAVPGPVVVLSAEAPPSGQEQLPGEPQR